MVRYCSCYRGIGFSNRTSLVRNFAGLEICSHCGGVVPPKRSYNYNPYTELDDFGREKKHESSYEKYCKKARIYSLNGDHVKAIGFYKDALKSTSKIKEKFDVLSAIADEYEAKGDYDCAEKSWQRCCEFEGKNWGRSAYRGIAGKGDFLYRRGRFAEAIWAYEDALETLGNIEDGKFDLFYLKYFARVTHFIIESYGKCGGDNLEEKYRRQFKCGIDRFIRSGKDDESKAYHMYKAAWEIFKEDGLIDEALILIDCAIELHPDCPADYYNTKAIILKCSFQYEEALKYYDKALSKDESNKTLLNNRAECEAEFIKSKLKIEVLFKNIKPHHLKQINKALKILPKGYDNSSYLNVKADILDQLGDPVKAWICRGLAAKNYEEVDKVERQLKELKSGETYINITGFNFYKGLEPFKEGNLVDLIRESDNPHDPDAIRVEFGGETVGYVANSKHTLIKEVKSATDIKNIKSRRAEVQFILFRRWVIAKLIRRGR